MKVLRMGAALAGGLLMGVGTIRRARESRGIASARVAGTAREQHASGRVDGQRLDETSSGCLADGTNHGRGSVAADPAGSATSRRPNCVPAYVNRLPVIFTIRPDGSRTRQLTHNDTYNQSPAWSPGGHKIVYGRTGPTGNHLVIMKRDGTDKHRITHGHYEIYPAWSPSGGRIAYACLVGNDFEICTVRTDGTHRRVLTDNDAYDNHVDWSPTGKRIAFGSDRDGDVEIYTMRPDGTHVRQITHNTAGDDNPSFSPSGRRIAYEGESRGGDTEIFIRNSTGHGARLAVTHNTRVNAQAAWSPAGGRIAYIEDNGTSADIYTIKVGGGDRHRVTQTRIDEDVPEWGPRPGR